MKLKILLLLCIEIICKYLLKMKEANRNNKMIENKRNNLNTLTHKQSIIIDSLTKK